MKTDLKTILEEYRKCTGYNLMTDYYYKTAQHQDFYIGNQWNGVNAPGLDKPVLNFIRRVCSFLNAMVTSDDISAFVTPYVHTAENTHTADIMNIALAQVFENSRLTVMARKAVLDAIITGDGYLYWYYADSTVKAELLKGTNVLFANPYLNDVQKQPFILIEQREYLDKVKNMAAENGQETKFITADENCLTNVECLPVVTLITKLYK